MYMKLAKSFSQTIGLSLATVFVVLFGVWLKFGGSMTFASDDENQTFAIESAKFVTFYDDGDKLTVKTSAKTVGEAVAKANIIVNDGDRVEPGLETEINADNFFINIYRARPVIVRDGKIEKYLMTASYDTNTIAKEAGMTIYDGDEIKLVPNDNFLETGAANVYTITRNGGRTLTVEEEIPFAEETVRDVSLPSGQSEIRQLGEVGLKRVYYNIYYIDNEEVSREMVGEEVIREPVPRITAVGVKKSVPPGAETCAEWVRAAGVSEADVAAAIDLIYHESGCRVDARNASSGAYGIPQALPGNKMASAGADWETNPVTQIRWMAGYVSRYGGWQGAIEFWYAHGWY